MPTRSWGPRGFGAGRAVRHFTTLKWSGSKLGALLLKVILLTCISVGTAHAISYTYDELGRLKAVTDDAGNSAEYLYDSVGNIVQIKQVPSGTLSLTEFTPNSGPVGASVTLFGGGFSAAATSNVVKFNGTAATVTSAAVNKLVVTVPAGATTGKITVTAGTTTATSIDDFTVTADNGAPTLTGFTPTCAAPGATVTLTGTNFDPAPNATKVELNNSVAPATVSSPTSITITVPPSVGGGKIRVVTPAGIATGTASLLVPPSALTCADILSSVTVAAGGANQTLTLGTANKYGAILFDGNQNDYLTLQLSNLITNPANVSISYTVYKPDNTPLVSGSISSTSLSVHLPALPITGTYTVLFNLGNATASFSAQLAANGSLSVNGAAVGGSTTVVGQSLRYSFTASAGQNLGLGISGLSLTPSTTSNASVVVYKPDGSALTNAGCFVYNGGCGLNLSNLLVTGSYSVVVTPPGGTTSSFTATLSSDLTGTLTANTPVSSSLRAGQNGWFSFAGSAGNSVGIEIAGIVTTPVNQDVDLTVYKPDGTTLTSTRIRGAGGLLNLGLPVTGSYTVFVDPSNGAAATLKVTLKSAALVIDGAASSMTLSTAGENGYFTFNASAGQNLGLGISGLTLTPSTADYAQVIIYKPDGTSLDGTSTYCYVSGCGVNNLRNLPFTGSYGVVVLPNSGATGSFTATLSSDLTGTLTANTPVSSSLRAGQNGRFSFTGSAGNSVGIEIAGIVTTPVNQDVDLTVYKPDGTTLTSTRIRGAGGLLNLGLPVTGSYTVFVDPSNGAAATLKVTLKSAALVIDGAASSMTLSTAGENGYFTFNASAGQNLGLGISGLTLTPSTADYAQVIIYKPDGTSLDGTSTYCYVDSCDVNLSNLPFTGSYGVIVQPNNNATGSFTVTLSSDLIGSLNYNLSLTRSGQNARLSFVGAAGQNLDLSLTGIMTNPTGKLISVVVYNPDGTRLTLYSTPYSTLTLTTPVLPVSGTYTVFIDPHNGATASMAVSR